jgi:hypothetical protein
MEILLREEYAERARRVKRRSMKGRYSMLSY